MYYLVLAIHVIVCLFLIIVVLLQSGKAADLAGAFGGMGSQTAFGPRGSATLLSKATTISAIAVHGDLAVAFDHGDEKRGFGTTVLERSEDARRRQLRYAGAPKSPTAPACRAGKPAQQAPAHAEEVATTLRRWRNWQTH